MSGAADRAEIPNLSLYVLGAGFSAAAGLPLGNALWKEIYRRATYMASNPNDRANQFLDDLKSFVEFKKACEGILLRPEEVVFEEFLGYLDVEHILGLRGRETWSRAGNETQVIVKTLIGQILTEHMPLKIPELYLKFARKLRPSDIVLTFNYDPLLEYACEAVGTPYRLVQERYSQVHPRGAATIDTSRREAVILKLHGSIDWFDRRPYRERVEEAERDGFSSHHLTDPIFNSSKNWRLAPLVDGPRRDDEPLGEVHKLRDLKAFYSNQPWFLSTPLLLTPSTTKLVYAQQFADLWWGLGFVGIHNFRMVIVGYSLPEHDEYARQAMYRLVKNYQDIPYEPSWTTKRKEPLVLVDKRCTETEINDYRNRYSFVNWENTHVHFNGLDENLIERL
jgi:SIR2-like domain